MQYTREDYQNELRECITRLNQKAIKHGIITPIEVNERKKQEEAARLNETTKTYLSFIKHFEKAQDIVKEIKTIGYDLKFSTETKTQYTEDAIIINVSSENPDDLKQDEISYIWGMLDSLISYQSRYEQLKETYKDHLLADSQYFEGMFEYVAVKEYYEKNPILDLKAIKRLMMMSGVYMYELGVKCSERRMERVLRKWKKFLKKIKKSFLQYGTDNR